MWQKQAATFSLSENQKIISVSVLVLVLLALASFVGMYVLSVT